MVGVAKVGGDVDAWCTRCKQMILHTVVAMVGNVPKKVQCNSCGSNHVYRGSPPGEGGRVKRNADGSRTAKRGALKPSDYEKAMEGRDPNSARRYSPKTEFVQGDVILHPKFGVGVAMALKDTTKIEVLFPDGARVLVHNR